MHKTVAALQSVYRHAKAHSFLGVTYSYEHGECTQHSHSATPRDRVKLKNMGKLAYGPLLYYLALRTAMSAILTSVTYGITLRNLWNLLTVKRLLLVIYYNY
jgi:hypothetical protein